MVQTSDEGAESGPDAAGVGTPQAGFVGSADTL
jgi:hypothetical protein